MADDPFWSNIFRRTAKSEEELYGILSKVPIFKDLNLREFKRIESILHRRSYAADESIVREGDMGVGMYVILSGEVEIVHTADNGETLRLASFSSGDFFGDQVLVDESARTASAIARSPCRAVGFFRPDLLELIERSPRLGLKIVLRLSQMMSVRLRQTNRLLKEIRSREDERLRKEAVEEEAAAQVKAQEAVAEKAMAVEGEGSLKPTSLSQGG
jgi:CRP-like cAMP-binding protein